MSETLVTPRLRLEPVRPSDVAALQDVISAADVAAWTGDLAPDLAQMTARFVEDSRAPAGLTTGWRIARGHDDCIGLVALCEPSVASLKLRAIGWRSRELLILLHPLHRRLGLATETVEAVAAYAARDGVTFALVANVPPQDAGAIALLARAGFDELGRGEDASGPRVIYERAL